MNLQRRLAAEGVGTALLLAAVVGSGIMGERLAGGNVAIALLANTIATGSTLVALILTFGPISGAHFNPAVTIADASQRGLSWRDVPLYIAAQLDRRRRGRVRRASDVWRSSCFSSRNTFGLAARSSSASSWRRSDSSRSSGAAREARSESVPVAVGLYITGAYWFTASTSFANPAVTVARALTNTFAGIRPADAPGFIAAQLAGALVATLLFRWLVPASTH